MNKILKIIFVLITLVPILAIAQLAAAQESELKPTTFSLDNNITIKSASEYDYPPFSIVTKDGKADGFSVELLRATLNATGYAVEFKVGLWSDIKEDLTQGRIQVLPLVGRTPERESIYDFTVPYVSLRGAIFVRKGDTSIKSLADLAGKEVLVMKDDNAEEFARRENVSSKIITTQTFAEAFKLLSDGKHDAVLTQRITGIQLLNDLGIDNVVAIDAPINEFRWDFTFAVKEGDSELLLVLNEGLSRIMSDGSFDRLYAKWFGTLSTLDTDLLSKPDETFAKESIKQKAVDVAKQVEIYIISHPTMTVADFQNDSYFQSIAVQQVGKTGYTAVTDVNTLINRFHQNPKIVNLDLSTLASKLPGFWGVMSKTRRGFEAEGVYDWQEADGRITQKYMYIAVVNVTTADGVRFSVAATTYLEEYAPVPSSPSASSASSAADVSSFLHVFSSYVDELDASFSRLKSIGPRSAAFMLEELRKKDSISPADLGELGKFGKQYAFIDSAYRTNLSYYKNVLQTEDVSGAFVSNQTQLTDDIKRLFLVSEPNFKPYAQAIKESFFNMYLITKENFIRIYEKNWALEIEGSHNFSTDSFYYIATPENDPGREPRWTLVYYDSIWKYWMTSLITPIYDGDKFLGILGHDVILNDVYKSIQEKTYGGNGYSFVFDSSKNIIVHPAYLDLLEKKAMMNEQLSFKELNEKGLSGAISGIGNNEGSVRFTDNGKEYLLFYRKLSSIDWYYGFVIEASLVESKPLSGEGAVSAEQPIADIAFKVNYAYLIIAIIGLAIYLFLLSSISKKKEGESGENDKDSDSKDDKNGKDDKNYKNLSANFTPFLVSGLLLLIAYVARLHVLDKGIAVFLIRLVVALVYLFVFYYMLSMFAVAKQKISEQVLGLLYLVTIVVVLLMLFTPLFVKEAVANPEIMAKYGVLGLTQGVLFPWALLVLVLYISLSLAALLIAYYVRKERSMKYFLLAFVISAIMVIPHAVSVTVFHFRNPLVPLLFPVLMAVLLSVASFKLGFLKQRKKFFLFLLIFFVIIIFSTFILNTYLTSLEMKRDALNVFKDHQQIMAEQAAGSIKAYMEFLINDAYVTAGNPDMLSDNPDEVQSVINRMRDRLDISPGGLIVSKLDKNGNVLMESSDPSNANEKNIQGAGFQELGDHEEIRQVIESHQATVSEAFISTEGMAGEGSEGSEGKQGISILAPLFRGDEFTGILRIVIFINETLVKQFISPLRFGNEGHGHLLIGETVFAASPYNIGEDFISNPAHVKILDELKAERSGFIMHTHNSSSEQGTVETEVISAYYPVPVLGKNWGVVVESPAREAYLSLTRSLSRLWLFTLLAVIFIIIMGAASSFFLTRNLRNEVLEKTGEIRSININLEKTVQKRTKELEQLNRELEERVNARTNDISKKVKEITDTKIAVLNILEDVNLSKDDLEKSHVDLLKLNKDMEKANTELKKSEEYKNQFISITAHELKTPLASIHGFAGLLQNKKILSNPKQRNYYLDIIQEDSERLKKLIDDILDLSRLDVGTMKFYFEKIDIKEIFKDLVKELYILAAKNKLTLNACVANNVPEIISDKSRLIQVLVNLVNNSIKYTPKKGEKINVYAVKKGRMVQFSVKDTGIGIPKSAYPKLFQRFFQVDSWLTRKVGGSGLGLSISKGVVETMGGKIWFESKVDKGSTFFFTLPLKPKSAAAEQDLKVIRTQSPSPSVPSALASSASAPLNPSSPLSSSDSSNSRIKK